jgi:hypothetical protein
MSSPSISRDSPQIIEGGYVDQRRLMDLLKDIYGTKDGQNNFKVEVGC